MSAIQVAVLGDHLRLKPQAEFHSHIVKVVPQLFQGSAHFFLVDKPVAKAAVVVVPLAEPSVIQHQHFNAQLRRLPGDVENLVPVEVEIGGFPVVDEHRTGGVLVFTAAHMLPQDVVILLGKLGQAVLRIAENHLGAYQRPRPAPA